MKFSYIVLFIVVIIAAVLLAPKLSTRVYTYTVLKRSEKGGLVTSNNLTMNYRLFVSSEKGDKSPLLIVLHHNGCQGNDNLKPFRSNVELISTVTKQYKSFVLLPQCPSGKAWTINPKTPFNNFNLDELPESPYLEALCGLILDVVNRHNIDPNRIYIAGHSMGATGLWEIILRHPELFAAAVPVCGASDEGNVNLCNNVAVWAFSAELDNLYDYKETELVIDTLKKTSNKEVKYTLELGKGHNIWGSTILNENTLNWLYKQNK